MVPQALHICILGYSATLSAEPLKFDKVGRGSSVHTHFMYFPDMVDSFPGPLTGRSSVTQPEVLNAPEKVLIHHISSCCSLNGSLTHEQSPVTASTETSQR